MLCYGGPVGYDVSRIWYGTSLKPLITHPLQCMSSSHSQITFDASFHQLDVQHTVALFCAEYISDGIDDDWFGDLPFSRSAKWCFWSWVHGQQQKVVIPMALKRLKRREVVKPHSKLLIGFGDALVILAGGFKHFLFSPLLGEMIQFDLRIFFRWVGEPTTN